MKNSYVNLHMNSYVLYSGSWNPEKKGLVETLTIAERDHVVNIQYPDEQVTRAGPNGLE